MPNSEFSVRRLFVTSGFAFAVAVTPVVAAFTAPAIVSGTLADCASGEDADQFTGSCVPLLVPNSPSPFSTPAGNPDIPEVDGIPCTGRDSGACIGLAEDAPQYVAPESTVGSSPTVTGSTN